MFSPSFSRLCMVKIKDVVGSHMKPKILGLVIMTGLFVVSLNPSRQING